MRSSAICFLSLAAAASIACAATDAIAQQVQITDGWIHAVPPFQVEAAGYLSLKSDKDDILTGISINSGGTATLHRTGGKEKGLKLPAGRTVTLAPGGNYIALVGSDAPLIPGSRVGMTLYFAHAEPETVELNVLSQANAAPDE